MINLDGLTMYVSSTASAGVVDAETRLHFRARGRRIIARYSGGNVARGVLVGGWVDKQLAFRYAQRELGGAVHGGHSVCEVLEHHGRTRIVERFTWTTRTGSGINVFDELCEEPAA